MKVLDAQRWILRGLTAEMAKRRDNPDRWIDDERMAVVLAANEWAVAKGGCAVTFDEVERIETLAVGHVDYASKLALYVAEMVCGAREVPA